jgi:glycosyltransferase involved in cell wall biosynthesis
LAGAPVAISEGCGAREAGFGLALEVAAEDVDGWTQEMRQAREGEGWRDAKARAARAAAAKAFTWQRNAKLTKKIYDEIGFYLASQHRAKALDAFEHWC